MELVNRWLPGDGPGVIEHGRVGRERPQRAGGGIWDDGYVHYLDVMVPQVFSCVRMCQITHKKATHI